MKDEGTEKVLTDKPLADKELEELSVEESFALLKEILAEMDSDEISLEESFAAYEKGIKLVRHCSEIIDRVEKKVLAFQENGELYEF